MGARGRAQKVLMALVTAPAGTPLLAACPTALGGPAGEELNQRLGPFKVLRAISEVAVELCFPKKSKTC